MKKAEKLYYNGTILTMDSQNTMGNAMAIDGDTVIGVGTKESLKGCIDEKTQGIDLQGRTVLPGFYDAHGHFLMTVECQRLNVNLNSPPVGSCANFSDIFEKLRERVTATKRGDWVVGYGFDDTMIAENRFLTRHDLDKVSTDHPIYVGHISGHLGVLNSLGLTLAGIDKESLDPEGGVIRREEDGKTPNGVLEETAVVNAMTTSIPKHDDITKAKAALEMGRYYAEQGTTTAIDAGMFSLGDIRFTQWLYDEYPMTVRLLYNVFNTATDASEADLTVRHPMVKRGGMKFLQDGSLQGFTGYLSQPYHTPFNGDAQWRGYPIQSREKLIEVIEPIHANGQQCIIHTNGDAATDDALAALEHVLNKYPRKDHRHLLIHAQTIREDQLDKVAQLGVQISFFSMHVYYWGDRHNSIFLGPQRTQRLDPMASAVKRGIVCTSHCDSPIVPYTPLLSIHTCVNRLSATGTVYGEDQKISVLEALRAHTINPAIQNFEDDKKGSLEPGKLADFVILDENPLECPPESLKDMTIRETVLSGQTVYANTAG